MNRYREEGTTTSPFDVRFVSCLRVCILTGYVQMMLCNHVSRYDVAASAVRGAALHNAKVATKAHEMASYIMHLATKDKEYIYREGRGKPTSNLQACSWIDLLIRPRRHL